MLGTQRNGTKLSLKCVQGFVGNIARKKSAYFHGIKKNSKKSLKMSPKNRTKSQKTKTKVLKCWECKDAVITDDEDSVECNHCKKWIHYQCCTLNKKQLQVIIDDDNADYKCHFCQPKQSSKTTPDDVKELHRKIDHLTSTVKFMSDQYDDFLKEIRKQSSHIKLIQKENKSLKSALNTALDDQRLMFTELNRNKVIIKGMKTSGDVSAVTEFIVEMAVKGGSTIVAEDIADVKLLSNSKRQASSSNQTAIVTFSSFVKKLNFVTKRRTIRQENCYKDISIGDLLSKTSQQLYTHAMALRRVGFFTVYHQNGVIYAKKTKEGSPIIIRSMDQVDALMRKSALAAANTQEDEETDSEDEGEGST